jgi:hypothetical protein
MHVCTHTCTSLCDFYFYAHLSFTSDSDLYMCTIEILREFEFTLR